MLVTRGLRAVLAGALLSLGAVVAAAAPAQAHALLTASSPADGGSVEQPPTELLLTYNEAPDLSLAVVRVLDGSGADVETGSPEPVAGQPTQVRVPLPEPPAGVYTATWRMTTPSDGHTTVGSVAFGVGVAAPAAAGGGEQVLDDAAPTAAAVGGRWAFYAGVVLLLGAAVVGVAVVADARSVGRGALVGAWVAAAGGLAIAIADQRASAQTGLGDLLASSTGQRLSAQAVAVVAAGAAVAWAWRRPSRASLAAVGVAASAAMLARAFSGHANSSSVRWFTVGTQWVHLVAVGAWVGGLVWLLVALRRRDPGQGSGLGRRFSAVAGAMLGVVVLSGTLRALDEVGAWDRLLDTSFGVTLLVKLGLFAALVLLGARNRFRHVRSGPTPRGLAGLQRLVRGEVAIAAGVLGATAVMASLPPAATVAAASKPVPEPAVSVTGNDYGTSVRVRLTATPGSAGPNDFESTVEDYDTGEAVGAEAVSLRFRLTDRPDVVPTSLELTRDGDQRWRASGNALSIDGRWAVTALVQTPTDAVAVPMELEIRSDAPGADPEDQAACQGRLDPTYSVELTSDPEPARAEGTTFRLSVRRDGRPVSGARVCMKVDMPAHQHPGVLTVATEASPGEYDATLTFVMTGLWAGSVVVAEPGRDAVVVPIRFDVT